MKSPRRSQLPLLLLSVSSIASVRLKVGLEIHVELATRTKMFSRAGNPANPIVALSEPNTLIDATVLALPGSLPVLNVAAIEMAVRVGLALNCRIAGVTRWDRKNYFYPDLPKAYQISQYDQPLCADGWVDLPPLDAAGRFVDAGEPTRIGIIRAHLEEDAGKLLHEAPGGGEIDGTLIDLNRAGTPLLEIVTAPDFEHVDHVVAFARLLRQICRYLAVTEGDMQKGHMRFEPNINTILTLNDGRTVAAPVSEVKNLNSFKSLRAAIEHELAEQPRRWEIDGLEHGPGMKRTLGWDDRRMVTLVQREKEDAPDYRYFADPDIPPLQIDPSWVADLRASIPDLPAARALRYMREYAIGAAEAAALIESREESDFFAAAVTSAAALGLPYAQAGKTVANLVLQSGARRANERGLALHRLGIAPRQAAEIAALRAAGEISAASADELFGLLCDPSYSRASASSLAEARGMLIVRDDAAIDRWCDEAVAAHPKAADDVRAGKMQAIGRLVGDVMQRASGQADAAEVRRRLIARLGAQ